jgi:hypothetical protein
MVDKASFKCPIIQRANMSKRNVVACQLRNRQRNINQDGVWEAKAFEYSLAYIDTLRLQNNIVLCGQHALSPQIQMALGSSASMYS